MVRLTLFLSFLCASLGGLACRQSKPLLQVDSAAAPPPAPITIQVPPPPAIDPNAPALHRRWEITVKADSQPREAQTMSVLLPGMPPVKSATVREAKGAPVPSQMQGSGKLALKIKALKAGDQAVYLVEEGPAAASKGGAVAVEERHAVKLTIDGKPVLAYQMQREPQDKSIPGEYWRNGYIHPLYSPAGVVVTDDYPKGKPNQHGIWSGWQKVEFGTSHPDFWDPGRKTGRASMESVGPLWSGPLGSGFGAHHYFTDLDSRKGATVFREGWAVAAFRESARSPYFVVDLEAQQDQLLEPVIFGQNPFGGITLRGSRDWQGADRSVFLTSEGQARGVAQGATARWCYLGGKVGGRQAGVAILSHPRNSREPEALFIDPQEPVMGFAPSKNGPITLKPGRPFKLQYRFVVLDGKPDSKLFDRLWNDFAHPPVIAVRELASGKEKP